MVGDGDCLRALESLGGELQGGGRDRLWHQRTTVLAPFRVRDGRGREPVRALGRQREHACHQVPVVAQDERVPNVRLSREGTQNRDYVLGRPRLVLARPWAVKWGGVEQGGVERGGAERNGAVVWWA